MQYEDGNRTQFYFDSSLFYRIYLIPNTFCVCSHIKGAFHIVQYFQQCKVYHKSNQIQFMLMFN